MGILEISFLGPFAYLFAPASNSIDIYAPKCPGHRGAIYSAVNQHPLRGRDSHGTDYTYVLSSPGITPGQGMIDSSTNLLKTHSPLSPQADPYFRLNVPMPALIHGINQDPVEVLQSAASTPKGNPIPTVTSLRFYYVYDLVSPITLTKPLCGPNPWTLNFIYPAVPGSTTIDHADLTVRYASTLEEDADHSDAQDCFLRMWALLGLDWWISYDDKSSDGVFVRSGVDCRAPIVLSQ
jgi:hypothetical protein